MIQETLRVQLFKKAGVLLLTVSVVGGGLCQPVAAAPRVGTGQIKEAGQIQEPTKGILPGKDGKASGASWAFDRLSGRLSITGSGVPVLKADPSSVWSLMSIPWYSFKDKIKSVTIDKTVRPMSMATWFWKCRNLEKGPEIPNSVTDTSQMFYQCSNLKEAPDLPDSVKTARNMFYECRNIKEAPKISYGLVNADGMFWRCSSMEKVSELPDSIQNVKSMFSGCSSLERVSNIPEKVTSTEQMFAGCGSLKAAPAISSGVTDTYCMFNGCGSLEAAPSIPEGVKNAGYMFNECSNLKMVNYIPDSVTDADNMFNGCRNLKSIPNIPQSVIDASWMLSGCRKLKTVPEIPYGIKNASCMFYECSNLEDVPVLPDSVTDASWMFSECSNLQAIPNIPENIKNAKYMFNECPKIVRFSRNIEVPEQADIKYLFGILNEDGTKLPTMVPYDNESLLKYPNWDEDSRQVIKYCVVEFQDAQGKLLKSVDVVYGQGLKEDQVPEAPKGNHWNLPDLRVIKKHLTIRAQEDKFKIVFKDWDGTVLKTENVKPGEGASAPEIPKQTGYVFTGWDEEFDSVVKDMVITALYQKNEKPMALVAAPRININKKQGTSNDGFQIKVEHKADGAYVSYQTNNSKVVAVNSRGYVKERQEGKAVITTTVKQDGKKFSFKTCVSVNGYVRILKVKKSLRKGKSFNFQGKAFGTKTGLKWLVSNKKVGKISRCGKFTGKKKGIVYVMVKSGKHSAKVRVKIK